MNKVTVKNILVLLTVLSLLLCMALPAFALPMTRGVRRMDRSAEVTSMLNDDILPDMQGNITEGETQDGIIGDDVPTTTTRKVTTTSPAVSTTTPATSTTERAPVSSAVNDVVDTARGSGFVVWGVVLAVVIAAAVVAVIVMTKPRRR